MKVSKRLISGLTAFTMLATSVSLPNVSLFDDFVSESQIVVDAANVKVNNVSNLKASSVTNTSAKLSWSKVKGAKGYYVYQYKNKKWSKIATTSSNKYTLKKLKANSKYTYSVKAYKKSGKKTILSSKYTKVDVYTQLSNATGLKATRTNNSVKLTWKKVTGAKGYYVYQKKNGKWSKIKTVSSTSYTVQKLSAGTSYSFAIRPYKTVSKKTIKSPKETSITTATNPNNVSGIKVSFTDSSAKITWKKVSGSATGYKVYRYNTKKKSWEVIKTINSVKTTSYTDSKLASGSGYSYTVKAYKVIGKSNYTSTSYTKVSGKTKIPPVTGLKAENITVNSANLIWNKNSKANQYYIYQKKKCKMA